MNKNNLRKFESNPNNKLRQIFLFLFFIAVSNILYSQVGRYPNPTGSSNFPSTSNQLGQDSIEQEELEDLPPDTILIYHPFQLKKFKYYGDTALDNQFHQYDDVRLQDIPFLHIGNNGSPNRPAQYKLFKYQGLDIGSHVLDIYKIKYEEFELLQSKRAITKFRFAQKSFSQLDLQLDSRFSKTFQNGLHVNLYYRTLNYSGEFLDQINKDRSGNFNIWYHSPKGNYDLIINYLTNDIKLQDNGGIIQSDSLLKYSEYRSNPKTITDYPINGRSRQRENAISIQNGFNINFKGSTLGFTHFISTSNQLYSYVDQVDKTDSIDYYGKFYTKDSIIVTINTKGLINDFRINGFIKKSSYLMAGLRHEFHNVNLTPVKSNLNLLFIHGQYDQSIGKNVQLHGIGQWGLLENFGEYYLKGNLEAASKNLGALEGHVIFQRSPIPLLFKSLYSNGSLLFANTSFNKPITNQIGGSFYISVLKLKSGIDQSILNNTIFLNQNRLPQQETGAIAITNLYADKSFDIGKFHSRHRVYFQFNTKNEIMRLPVWAMQNTLYYQSQWFKINMPVMIGLDSRVIPSFKTKSYFPMLGNFYNEAGLNTVNMHPATEFFFNFQLSTFRGFFKYEGLEYFLYPAGKVFYETLHQPYQRSNIRLGLTWVMRD